MHTHNSAAIDRDAFKGLARLATWTFAWAATLALARFGPEHAWDFQRGASWAAIGVNIAVGAGWIVAHARYLRSIDELQRKIMMDALAVTLGVAWVGGFGYIVAQGAGIIDGEANIGLLTALLSVVYMLAIAAGNLRYR